MLSYYLGLKEYFFTPAFKPAWISVILSPINAESVDIYPELFFCFFYHSRARLSGVVFFIFFQFHEWGEKDNNRP